jgi:hypothetical protein
MEAGSELLIARLRQRGDLAAAQVIRHNRAAFAALGDADRRRAEAVAYAVAARLLAQPVSRLMLLDGGDANDLDLDAVAELFGLTAPAPVSAGRAPQQSALRRVAI